MKAPFEHMRNALAHGIEAPEDRAAAEKPADGTVASKSAARRPVVLRVRRQRAWIATRSSIGALLSPGGCPTATCTDSF